MKNQNTRTNAANNISYEARRVKYEMMHSPRADVRRQYARIWGDIAEAMDRRAHHAEREVAWERRYARALRESPAGRPGAAIRRVWEYDPYDTDALYAMAISVARGVVRKLYDPQRMAGGRDDIVHGAHRVSDSGCSPVMAQILRTISHDIDTLAAAARGARAGTALRYTSAGDVVTGAGDRDAAAAANTAAGETVCTGADVVQTAIAALLDVAGRCRRYVQGWMDQTMVVRRPVRRVVAVGRAAEYRDETITYAQYVYRAVRRYIQAAASIQDHSVYMYTDADGQDDLDPMDRVYWRAQRYADVAGADVSRGGIAGSPAGYPSARGLITADVATVRGIDDTIALLDLSARQEAILRRRLAGDSLDTISADLGVDRAHISRTMRQIMDRWVARGLPTPAGWEQENKPTASAARAVAQYRAGAEVARYASVSAASKQTGINAGNIRKAAQRGIKAGGFNWRYV